MLPSPHLFLRPLGREFPQITRISQTFEALRRSGERSAETTAARRHPAAIVMRNSSVTEVPPSLLGDLTQKTDLCVVIESRRKFEIRNGKKVPL